MDMKVALTFDDVALVPYKSNLKSRTEPVLTTHLTKNIKIESPVIASNMESVICDQLSDILELKGSMPIYHRFCEDEDILAWNSRHPNTFISWGVSNMDKLFKLLDIMAARNTLPPGICFDIANGHTIQQEQAIRKIKEYNSKLEIIGGNICSKTACHDMISWGADAVRVGVGCGSACTTRMVTGFGVPQFTAIQNCYYVAKQHDFPIIADGGLRNSRDIILALAAGASTVMVGKMFAATHESAALKQDGYARYRGQASSAFQRPGLAPEGVEGWIPVTGSAADVLDTLHSQIRSGLSYGGARTIEDLQKHAQFVRVTSAYYEESKARI